MPRAFYVKRAADFRSSLRSPTRQRFAIFSDSASPADVAALSLPHDDVDHLADCQIGSCNLKLSAGAIARVRAMMDSAPSAPDSVVNRYFRGRAIEYVTAYRVRGNAALIAYADEDSVTAAAHVFDAMLSRSPYLYQYAPSLEQYLKNYPKDRPLDLSEALFWADDDLPGLQRTITITHEVVYAPPELPGCTLIVAKQLYADHYLDGAINVTAVVDQVAPPDSSGHPGIYLVFLRATSPDLPERMASLSRRGADTDVLDAYALLWTARRLRDGTAKCLPENPQYDSRGLRAEILG